MIAENYSQLQSDSDIRQENRELRHRLDEVEEMVRAIRQGEIDGLIIDAGRGEQVFTLLGADHPYRMLIEQMNEGALTLMPDGTILYGNSSFARMLQAPLQGIIGSSVFKFIDCSNLSDFQEKIDAQDIKGSYEINLLRGDGSRLPVCCSLNSMMVAGVPGVAMIVTELTEIKNRAAALKTANQHLQHQIAERQRIEEVLRNNEQQLEQANRHISNILTSISDPFFTLDEDWRFTYNNQAAQEYFSNYGVLLGQKLWEVFPEAVGSTFWQKYHEVMKNKRPVCFEAYSIITNRYLLVNVYPFDDGISVLFRDITRRKKAEEALKETEERFTKAFVSSPVMMAISDCSDNRYVDLNSAWLETFGLSREQAIGRTSFELNIFCDLQDVYEKGLQLKKNKKLHSYEVLFRNSQGETRVGLASSEIIRINERECYLYTMLDITGQKQMEKEISRLDRLNMIGEMAASIGHEIRNPMTAIRGFLQVLSSKECYAEDLDFFDLMIEELDRANSIISEYLGMAKNKLVELQPNYLDEIVTTLYPMLQADANYREMEVHLELGQPPELLVDQKEMRQLILNLSRNGLEAMPPRGTLTIGTRVEDREIVMYVKDQGTGLPVELLDKLGTPFLTTKENGTGLGLAVCYSIAARNNARLDYDTGPNGTTFFVSFPRPLEQGMLF